MMEYSVFIPIKNEMDKHGYIATTMHNQNHVMLVFCVEASHLSKTFSLQADQQLSAIRTILVIEEVSQLSHFSVRVSLME